MKLLNVALPGKFTINEGGDQVCFSRGNMYWDGDSFEFKDNQYDYSTALSASHVSHLYWSKMGLSVQKPRPKMDYSM
ncbi:MAG: hypothetical protein MJY58_06780 [Bacteroidaceae bacterium]|nr:hypothetical protein [Bacteroidaceae bacterium]